MVRHVPERDHGRSSRPRRRSWPRRTDAAAAVLRAARAARGAQHVRARRARAEAARPSAARSTAAGRCTASGRSEPARRLDLGGGASVELIPRARQDELRDACCASHDVGLALMYTPHPSLVPIEMASAGMLTVTNTFENKTADALARDLAEPDRRRAGHRRRRRRAVRRGRGRGRRRAARAREPRATGAATGTTSFGDALLDRVAGFATPPLTTATRAEGPGRGNRSRVLRRRS